MTPQPTPTPAPVATLMSGWRRFEGKKGSIALPDTFIGGDFTSADQEILNENLKALGSDFQKMAETIKHNPESYLLYVIDTEPTQSGIYTNLNLAREKTFSFVDPAAYMKAAVKQLPAQFKVVSRDEITLFGEPAGKMIIELTLANANMTEVMYVFKRGEYMYLAVYTTGSAEFEEKLPVFEQSVKTITINPEL